MYEWIDPGPLHEPVLIVAFDGWVNAGDAGTRAAEVIAGGGAVTATFDADALYDFRANRPTVSFVEGVMEGVTWPSMELVHVVHEDRDLLVLSGVEPNWHWQAFASQMAKLAVDVGVTEQISLGGIPWAAPHTRPVRTIVTSSDANRVEPDDDHPEGRLEVPGAAVNVVAGEIAAEGIPTLGFWARVPHYIGTTHHASALALVERVALHLAIHLPIIELVDEADQQMKQLDAIAAGRPQVQAMVEQLETLIDEQEAVSGEDLAAEIQRFLRERDDDATSP